MLKLTHAPSRWVVPALGLCLLAQSLWRESNVLYIWQLTMLPLSELCEFNSRWARDHLSASLWVIGCFPQPEKRTTRVCMYVCMYVCMSRRVVSCPVQPRACHWSCVFWRDFSGVKRTCWTTGSWRSCLSLEVVSSIPAGSTIIYRFLCGFICVSLCQSIPIKPTNMYVCMYVCVRGCVGAWVRACMCTCIYACGAGFHVRPGACSISSVKLFCPNESNQWTLISK